jgi:hypothetical protein
MEGYGVPEGEEGMLPWSHVVERLESARGYWIGTSGADGRPHAMPLWGVWVDGALYFGTGPGTRTGRNLAANLKVAVHLDSSDDVVVVEGIAEWLPQLGASLFARIDDTLGEKYGWRPSEEGMGDQGMYVLRPRVAFAWSRFPEDATRWQFKQ